MSLIDGVRAPIDWRRIRFGRLCHRSRLAGRPDVEPLSVFLDEGVVPRASREDNYNRLGEDLTRYLVVSPGDIVFNKLRTWQGGFGASNHFGIVSPAYYVCRPGPALHARFAHYLLKSAPYLAELTRVSKWMPPSQFDVAWDDMKQVSILVPPRSMQVAIANHLDRETARIDSLITAKRRMHSLLAERDSAVLSAILMPEGVQLARLRFFASLQTGLTVDGSRESGPDAVTRPYLRVANVQAGWLDLRDVTEVTLAADLAARSTLGPGDVLMTEGGDLDKLGRGTLWEGQLPNCLHQNHVFAVRPDQARLAPPFLALLTRTSQARHHFESTGVQTTNLASTNSGKILDMPVPVLTLDQQRQLVRRYAGEANATNDLMARLRRQIALLNERRHALITAAVTGQLDIPTVAE